MNKEELLQALLQLKAGNFNKAFMHEGLPGIDGEIASVVNELAGASQRLETDIEAIMNPEEENFSTIQQVSGPYARCIRSINELVVSVADPTAEALRVIDGNVNRHSCVVLGC